MMSYFEHAFSQSTKFRELLKKVAEMDSRKDIPQTTYVIEECAELSAECMNLIKAITKNQRGKIDVELINAEACDVLSTIFVMLYKRGMTDNEVRDYIISKYERALDRYNLNGEL